MSACEIVANLWLGNIKASKSSLFFDENNIDVVINCSKDIPFYSNYTENIRIAVDDSLEEEEIEKLYTYMDKATILINTKLLEQKSVLVHCYAGKQRSAAIVAAYLMKYGNLSLNDSLQSIKSKRLIAFTPGINFKNALNKFEKYLLN